MKLLGKNNRTCQQLRGTHAAPKLPFNSDILAQGLFMDFPNTFNHNSPADWAREL